MLNCKVAININYIICEIKNYNKTVLTLVNGILIIEIEKNGIEDKLKC